MRRVHLGVVAAALVAAVLALVPSPAAASVSAPRGGSVEAGRGTSFTASFTPTVGLSCPSISGGGDGISFSMNTACAGPEPFSRTVSINTSGAAAGRTYDIVVADEKDGDSTVFTLTVRPAPTTTTAAPPPPPPPTTVAPPPPPTTAAPPPTTAPPPPPTTTVPPTTTTEAPTTTTTPPADPGAFASISSLVDKGLPEEGMFLPLVGAGYARCVPLKTPCADEDSALLLLPADDLELSWASDPEGWTSPPRLDVRQVLPLQPVGEPPSDQPSTVNYQLTVLDLADQGQLKSLARGLNSAGEFVSPSAEQSQVTPQPTGVEIPDASRTFLASEPFGKPYRMKTAGLTEVAAAVPLFHSTQPRIVYAVRAEPSWKVGVDIVPLLGNGNVPYVVRDGEGPPGLLVPIPPGATLGEAPEETVESAAVDEDDDGSGGGGLPIVPIAAVIAVLALGAGGFMFMQRRRLRSYGGADDITV